VALRSVRAPVRQRFLVGAMANAALHLAGAGRGLAGPVVCDANDLAQAAAGAGIHGGTPVVEARFGLYAAALAEDFGHCGHQHSAPNSDVFPFHRGTRPAWQPGAESVRIPGANVSKPCAKASLEQKWQRQERNQRPAAAYTATTGAAVTAASDPRPANRSRQPPPCASHRARSSVMSSSVSSSSRLSRFHVSAARFGNGRPA
jgi:hypothetical protein